MRIYLNTVTKATQNPFFSHVEKVEPYDEIEKGQEVEVFYKDTYLGTAEIAARRFLPFTRLSDLVTYLAAGLNVQQYAAILQRRYSKVEAQDQLAHIILHWTTPDEQAIASFTKIETHE